MAAVETVTGSELFNMSLMNNTTELASPCARQLPHASEYIDSLTTGGRVLLAILIAFTVIIVINYIEEIIFIMKNFKIGFRKKKTIWILSCFPMWSVCGVVAVCVPKAGPLIDMVSNMFFGTCLYHFGKLMIHYMGGAKGMWKIIGNERRINTNTLPVCCCCLCLPQLHFKPINFLKINIMIMQVAIVRPFLWFTAAILWTNNALYPGLASLRHSYIYIICTNILSTSTAVYGLMLLRNAFRPELEKPFFIMGKFASVQLSLIVGSAIPLIILAILIGNGVIGCGPVLTQKGRADEIYHTALVVIMLPLSLLGRLSFRRVSDGSDFAERIEPEVQNGGTVDDTKTRLDASDGLVVEVPFKVDPAESDIA